MGKYVHYFNTAAEADLAYANNYIKPWTSYSKDTGEVKFNKKETASKGVSSESK